MTDLSNPTRKHIHNIVKWRGYNDPAWTKRADELEAALNRIAAAQGLPPVDCSDKALEW
jgi:hypothetical protein